MESNQVVDINPMVNNSNPLERLEDEVICVICMEYFTEPVILCCGHNFCQACILSYWEKEGPKPTCPQCEDVISHKGFQPNRQLANVVEIAKELSMLLGKKGDGGNALLCQSHLEPLKVFCKNDDALICVVCRESQNHKDHSVLPIEEAAQQCKGQIQKHLEAIKKARDEIAELIARGKERGENLLNVTNTEMQEAQAQFKEFHQYLEDEEHLLVARVEKVNKEIIKRLEKYSAELEEAISLRDGFIHEMEEKCKQPAEEFLQDIKIIMESCEKKEQEKFENPVALRPGLKHKVAEITYQIPVIKRIIEQFKDALSTRQMSKAENMTLDPETAHPILLLSKDLKDVQWDTEWKVLPSSSLRFDSDACVLGSCGFTSGRHYWIIEIENEEGGWAIGVAKESISRKGVIRITSEVGIWALVFNGTSYGTLAFPLQMTLKLCRKPTKVQVWLEFDKDQVIFMDADTKVTMFVYKQCSFSGEKIYPWFKVGNGSILKLWPRY